MVWMIWLMFALVVGLLALSAWGVTAALDLALPLLGGSPDALEQVLNTWQPPVWLNWLVGAGAWDLFKQASLWGLEALASAGPVVNTLAGWLAPLVWLLWGFSCLVLLVLAVGMHLLVARSPAVAQGLGSVAGAVQLVGGRKAWLGMLAWQLLRRSGHR